jgi:hypothetical protein
VKNLGNQNRKILDTKQDVIPWKGLDFDFDKLDEPTSEPGSAISAKPANPQRDNPQTEARLSYRQQLNEPKQDARSINSLFKFPPGYRSPEILNASDI